MTQNLNSSFDAVPETAGRPALYGFRQAAILSPVGAVTPSERLHELGLTLPKAPSPVASYVPTRLVPIGDGRSLLFVAGQGPTEGDRLIVGRCPDQVSVEKAQEAARFCALNVLAQMESAAGLQNVEQVVQMTGFVLSTDGFSEQPKVLNGASDLMVAVLGDAGRHSRTAVGTNALPFSVTVEITAIAVVRTR